MNWNGSSLQGVSQINGNLLYYEDVTTSTLLGWQTSAHGATRGLYDKHLAHCSCGLAH